MRIMNSFTLAALMISVSLSAQNTPAATAIKPSSPQPRVFIPPATRVAVPTMQRRIVAVPKPELQQIPAPVQPVVSPRPRPEPELVVTPAAPATAQGTGELAVDFRNGQLSVVADDAELGKVLQQIGEKTGASVEVAPEVTGERVIAHLGPGPAAEIVATLLNSPRIDFILMGSEDQGSIKLLIVRRKGSFGKEIPESRAALTAANQPEPSAAERRSGPPSAHDPTSEPAQEAPPR